MNALVTAINELAAAVLPALWRASWQGGLALLLVFVLCRAVRRIPALAQCWLWRLAYVKLLIVGLWIVPVELRWLPPPEPTADATPMVRAIEPSPPPLASPIAELPVEDAVVTAPLRDPVSQPASTADVIPRLSGRGWLLIAWMAGVTLMLANLTRHGIRVRRLLARLTPVTSGPIAERLSEHCRQMRVRRPPQVRVAEGASSPFLVGVLRPVIVLPAAVVESCTPDELDAVLIHELAHIRRRDLLWNWVPTLAETAFFFHPLLWLTRREWRTAQEIATDELAVTASRLDAAQYARALIDLVARTPDPKTSPHLAVALSEAYTQLSRRMQAIQSFQPLSPRRRVTIALTVLALAAAGLVPWKLTAQESQNRLTAPETSAAVNDAAVAQSTPESDDSEQHKVQTRPISISGRALDSDGRPIAGATMYLSSLSVDWKRLAETVTDRTGRYEFREVPLPLETSNPFGGWTSGKFEVFGIADGYGFGWRPPKWYFPERYPSIANSNWEEEDPPERFYADEPIELDVTFRPAAKLGGRIVDDTGRPIPDASVAIRYCDPELDVSGWSSIRGGTEFDSLNNRAIVPPAVKLRRTDADGRFEFTGLPADCRFRIDVRPPGFPSRWIWAVTCDESLAEAAGNLVYGDGMVLAFVRAEEVALRIAYGDIGTPAAHVRVSAGSPQGGSGAVSDHEGRVSLRLSPGEYAVELLPRIGTPYLVTNLPLTVPVEQAESPMELRLRPAAVVEVSVIDESTGVGIADVDFWSCDGPALQGLIDRRELHYFRSYEAPTRICHVERPRTDADGKLRALFPPGRYRIGVGLNSFPHKDYRNLDAVGQEVALEVGKTTEVTFRVRRRQPANANGADAQNNQPGRTITTRVVDEADSPVEEAKLVGNSVIRSNAAKRTKIKNETHQADADDQGEAPVAITPQEIIRKCLARSQALKSGSLHYHLKIVIAGKTIVDEDRHVVFSGESWKRTYLGEPALRVHLVHDGRFYDYVETPQKDGRVTKSLEIRFPSRALRGHQFPPVFAGTIWDQNTRDFVMKHAASARNAGSSTIDDMTTHVLEWQISPKQAYDAFQSVNELTAKGGTLRMHVAPQMGYVVPRLEHVDQFGTVQKRFDARNFKEVATHVMFPFSYEISIGTAPYRTYEVHRVDRINQQIPESELLLSIPSGTRVQDTRPKRLDETGPNGSRTFKMQDYPYRHFTVGAPYPNGFPAKLLTEMDRDVIDEKEASR